MYSLYLIKNYMRLKQEIWTIFREIKYARTRTTTISTA